MFNPLLHPALVIPAVLLALLAVLLLPLRNAARLSRRVRWTLVALRAAAVVVLAVILLNPSRSEPQKLPAPRRLNLLLLDSSQSMSLETPSRMRQSLDVLRPALASDRFRPYLLAFRFDAGERPVPVPLDALGGADPVPTDGTQTRLYHNLLSLAAAHADEGIANVVVLSDGQAHDTAAADAAGGARPVQGELVKFCQEHEIPVSSFVAGSSDRIANTTIENIRVDRVSPPEADLSLDLNLRYLGAPPAEVTLTLRATNGNIRAQQTFPAATRFKLPFKAGTQSESYTLDVDTHQPELTRLDNSVRFDIKVENPKIRVLYMEGSPEDQQEVAEDSGSMHPAYELIPRALHQAGDIEVETLLVDQQLEVGGKLYRISDPNRGFPATRDELLRYDVVICSDINRYVFTDDQLEWVRQLVADHGGGFVMIGGNTSFGSGGWDKTAWEKMIPVDMSYYGEGLVWRTVHATVPDEARNHPVWKLLPDEAANNRVLAEHPEFLGTNRVTRAKAGATVLLRTASPKNQGGFGYYDRDSLKQPLICVQPYGKGRSMAFTSDAAGGWGKYYHVWGVPGKDNRYYRRFWVNAVRWLAENSMARRGQTLVGSANRLVFQPGETAAVSAVMPKRKPDDPAPVAVTVRFEGRGDAPVTLQFDPATQTFNGAVKIPGDMPSAPANLVFAAVNPKTGASLGADTLGLQVLAFDKEFANPAPNPDDLANLARLTHGRVLKDASDLTALLNDSQKLTRQNTETYSIPLWDTRTLWLALLAILAAAFLTHRLAAIRG